MRILLGKMYFRMYQDILAMYPENLCNPHVPNIQP